MAKITLAVKTFEFRDRHWAHLGMKVKAMLAKITTQIVLGAMFHKLSTPLWMQSCIPYH